MKSQPILKLSNISKAFPGVQALSEVSFDLYPGEVHALMGENGAGKSTLMKIIAGVYQPDSGVIEIESSPVRFQNPVEAQRNGICTIFQELTVLDNLDIGRNIMLGREPNRGPFGMIDWDKLYSSARKALEDLDLPLEVRHPLSGLSVGTKQMVEITRAVAQSPRVVIMDEPSSSLGKHEEERLFKLIYRLKERGVAIIYISHRMDEVFRLADRITVLRDGRFVATHPASGLDRSQLIALMVGRDLTETVERVQPETGASVVLEVRHLSRPPRVKDVSLQLRAGEVLGMAGLVGAGRTELARLIFGADRTTGGLILVDGQPIQIRSPGDAIRAGIAYVPEDRKDLGLALMLDVENNMILAGLDQVSRHGLISRGKVRALVGKWINQLHIRTPSSHQIVETLSGGNQQKIVLAKWLARNPRILLLDEPTRGIDVGAKTEIYQLIRAIAAQGVAVLMISSELSEILLVSDRIIVLHNGRVSGELAAYDATEPQVLELAFGGEVS